MWGYGGTIRPITGRVWGSWRKEGPERAWETGEDGLAVQWQLIGRGLSRSLEAGK